MRTASSLLLFLLVVGAVSGLALDQNIDSSVPVNVESGNRMSTVLECHGDLVWAQNPDCRNIALFPSQLSLSGSLFDARSADDFMFEEAPGTITCVRWWAGEFNGAPPYISPTSWNIFIYNNINDCYPSNAAATWEIDAVDCHETLYCTDQRELYSYWARLDPPFVPQTDTHYWMVIQAVMDYRPQIGWVNTSEPVQLCSGLTLFPEVGYTDWTPHSSPMDHAFELYAIQSDPSPTPTSGSNTPTYTPVSTNTPVHTHTPLPTVPPTSTPVPPTSTPTIRPPTETPTATPTMLPGDFRVLIAVDIDGDPGFWDPGPSYAETVTNMGGIVSDIIYAPTGGDIPWPVPFSRDQYDIVIVLAGENYHETPGNLGESDEVALMSYLDSGGRLIMIGQDILWGSHSGWGNATGFFNTHLGIASVIQDSVANAEVVEASGSDGSILDGLSFVVNGSSTGGPFHASNLYPDTLVPVPGALPLIEIPGAAPCAISYTTDVFQSIFSTLEIGAADPDEFYGIMRQFVVWLTDRPDPTPTPTVTPTITSTPVLSTATPSPSSTPTPTNTPEPPTETPVCDTLGCKIDMPGHDFGPGDSCYCNVSVCNPDDKIYLRIPIFVVLDVYGNYFFAPSFSGYDYFIKDISQGETVIRILQPFTWPTGVGKAEHIYWHAAMTDKNISGLIGDWDSFEFGWHE